MIRLFCLATVILGFALSSQAEAPKAPDGWRLSWHDEFDGTVIDPKKWDFDIGNGFYAYHASQWISGWGNNELQYYTKSTDNAFVKDGHLHIRALKESLHNCGYSSARLKTRKKDGSALFNQRYGRFEFRAKLPVGQGLWPALWLLPQENTYGTWPASGEIDVLEVRGHQPRKILGTIHFGATWPANAHQGGEHLLPADNSVSSFHTYAVEWQPGEIRWFVDGKQYAVQNSWWSSSKTTKDGGVTPTAENQLNPWPAPFDKPFYLIMNLAVGGQFPGPPDATTPFPAEMLIDYVRVYEKIGGYGKPKPRQNSALPFKAP